MAYITCVVAGLDSACDAGTSEAGRMSLEAADSTTSGACFVGQILDCRTDMARLFLMCNTRRHHDRLYNYDSLFYFSLCLTTLLSKSHPTVCFTGGGSLQAKHLAGYVILKTSSAIFICFSIVVLIILFSFFVCFIQSH